MLRKSILAAAILATTATVIPAAADAYPRHRGHGYSRHYDGYGYGSHYRYGGPYGYGRGYYGRGYGYYGRGYGYYPGPYGRYHHYHCNDGATGAIVGGAAGALLGREIARSGDHGYYGHYRGYNDGTAGAIIGGAIGALVGSEIARNC